MLHFTLVFSCFIFIFDLRMEVYLVFFVCSLSAVKMDYELCFMLTLSGLLKCSKYFILYLNLFDYFIYLNLFIFIFEYILLFLLF